MGMEFTCKIRSITSLQCNLQKLDIPSKQLAHLIDLTYYSIYILFRKPPQKYVVRIIRLGIISINEVCMSSKPLLPPESTH